MYAGGHLLLLLLLILFMCFIIIIGGSAGSRVCVVVLSLVEMSAGRIDKGFLFLCLLVFIFSACVAFHSSHGFVLSRRHPRAVTSLFNQSRGKKAGDVIAENKKGLSLLYTFS